MPSFASARFQAALVVAPRASVLSRNSMVSASPFALRIAPSRKVQPASFSSACAFSRLPRSELLPSVLGGTAISLKASGGSDARKGSINAISCGVGIPLASQSVLPKTPFTRR